MDLLLLLPFVIFEHQKKKKLFFEYSPLILMPSPVQDDCTDDVLISTFFNLAKKMVQKIF